MLMYTNKAAQANAVGGDYVSSCSVPSYYDAPFMMYSSGMYTRLSLANGLRGDYVSSCSVPS